MKTMSTRPVSRFTDDEPFALVGMILGTGPDAGSNLGAAAPGAVIV